MGVYQAVNALTTNNMQRLSSMPGLIRVGSRLYPPLRPLLIAAVLGGVTIGSISILIKQFWLKYNYHALEILERLFVHLMRLSEANNHFTMYMRNSEATANDVFVNIQTLKQQITSSSVRIRKMNRAVCKRASKATTEMIDSIEKVLTIDINQWASYSIHQIPANQTHSMSNQQAPALTYDFD